MGEEQKQEKRIGLMERMEGKRRRTAGWAEAISRLLIAVVCFGIFFIYLGNCDELWNYNFGRNIAEGMVPYRDFNMVQTPLSAYILAGIFLLFGERLLIYRIAGFILMLVSFQLFYSICKRITRDSLFAFAYTLFFTVMNFLCWIYNYNYMTLTILLAVLYLELVFQDTRPLLTACLSGFLIGLCPLIKQNTGAFLLIGNFILCAADILYYKKPWKQALLRAGMSLVPPLLFVCVWVIRGNWESFFEYAVLGIGTFSHRITFIHFMTQAPVTFCLSAVPLGIGAYIICGIYRNGCSRLQFTYLTISVTFLSMAYPLCDFSHLFCAVVPLSLTMLLYMGQRGVSARERFLSKVAVTAEIYVAALFIWGLLSPLSEKEFSSLRHYEGIPVISVQNEEIHAVDDYILAREAEGKYVYIADSASAVYTIPLDRYDKFWDMLLVGNIGLAGIEDILPKGNGNIFLVLDDEYKLEWQNYFELIQYVKDHYTFAGRIGRYDIYQQEE